MKDRRVIAIGVGPGAPGGNVDLSVRHEALFEPLRQAGWEVHTASNLATANKLLLSRRFLAGMVLAGELDDALCTRLDEFLTVHDTLEWVGAFSAEALRSSACRCLITDHLFDHLTLPVAPERLLLTLGHAHGRAALRVMAKPEPPTGSAPIIGRSPEVTALVRQIRRVAKVDAPVLIGGESGTGKELAAQAIQRWSVRADGPFISINCGAIPPSLVQSELFGHTRGAFTGADRDKRGLFETADGGTVFLDEIGDLSQEVQVSLLRFLQEKTIMRVGSTQSQRLDVRVIAATHVDLRAAIAAGTFREDLYYRLNVLTLDVPPLRARKGDVELLAHHFFKQFAAEKSPQLRGFSQRALAAMAACEWKGNVRELLNRVRRAMVMAEGRLITPADLGLEEATEERLNGWEALDDARTEAERSAIYLSLANSRKNVTQAAKQLGVSRMTLYRLMAKHGIGH